MTGLEIFTSCFPITKEDIHTEFFNELASTLHTNHHVIIPCDDIEEFRDFYQKEYGILPSGGALVLDGFGKPTKQVLYI